MNKTKINMIVVIVIVALLVGFYFGMYLPKKARIAEQQKQEQKAKAQAEEYLKKAEQEQEQKAIESEEERIKALLDATEEVTLTNEELKSYYATYKDPFVLHVRKALNGYLAGTNEGMESPDFVIEKGDLGGSQSGLASFDKEYYKSKFIVFALDDSLAGGKEAQIIFQDKPDKFFTAWVYDLAGDSRYDFRGFWENAEATKDIDVTLKAFRKYIFDKDHSL